MSVPADQIEAARQHDILAVAHRFVILKKIGANEYAGACPGCGGVDRFGVNTRKQVFNCRGCGAKGDVIALVRLACGVSFAEAVEDLAGEETRPVRPTPRKPDPAPTDDAAQRRKAAWLWAHRAALAGSIAEAYLREARGCGGRLPATLGFLRPAKPEHHPALIAAFAMPGEVEPGVLEEPASVGSVHLTLLKPDGSGKAPVKPGKIAVGAHSSVPIVVAPVNDLLGLAICEGVEDALTAAAIGLGAWAAGGATFMPALAAAIPNYVECVTIFAHADDGLKYAQELERRLLDRAVEVRFDGL